MAMNFIGILQKRSYWVLVLFWIWTGQFFGVFIFKSYVKKIPKTKQLPNIFYSINPKDTWEITRLDIMAYLEPASNFGSKPQRLDAANCKSSTPDKLQTFRTIFGISCKYLTKNCFHEVTLFILFWRGISCKRNHETFQDNKEKNQWFEIKCPVLIAAWLNPT